LIVGLDTSVVLRLLLGEPKDLALIAVRALRARQRAGHRVLVSDWVVAEAYHALQHHYGNSKKDALEALRVFLTAPGVENPGGAAEVLARPHLESARPGFIDRIIHRDYQRSHAEAMITFEKAAAKLPGVQVLTA
jgi:predicted nucleic-acid-binding protein